MNISGGCFCGSLRYEATINQKLVGVCHCRDCQIFSGSAFRTSSVVPPADFKFTHGQPKLFKKVADTGNARDAAFCGTCGSHICTFPEELDAEGAFISLRWATSDQFDQVAPVFEVFCDSKVSWLGSIEDAMQFPRMPIQQA